MALFDAPPWLQSGLLGPIAGSMPAPAQAPQMGILDRLGQGIANNPMTLMSLGAGIMNGGLGQGLQSAMMGSQMDQKNRLTQQQQMATYQALKARGLSNADALAAMFNPEMLKALLPVAVPKYDEFKQGQLYGIRNPYDPRGPQIQGAVPEYKDLSPGQVGGYATPPIPSGPAAPSGPAPSVAPTNQPDNMSLTPSRVARVNGLPDPSAPMVPNQVQTTSVPPSAGGFRPVASGGSVIQNAADQAQGKAMGEARQAYPDTVANLSQTLQNIQDIRAVLDKSVGGGMTVADANLGAGRGLGWVGSWFGGPSADFRARLEQLDAKSFMVSIQQMKGLGALSNAEGLKASSAFARLQTSQDEGAFRKSLKEVEDIVRTGLDRAKLQAFGRQRLDTGTAAIPAPPQGFTVIGR